MIATIFWVCRKQESTPPKINNNNQKKTQRCEQLDCLRVAEEGSSTMIICRRLAPSPALPPRPFQPPTPVDELCFPHPINYQKKLWILMEKKEEEEEEERKKAACKMARSGSGIDARRAEGADSG